MILHKFILDDLVFAASFVDRQAWGARGGAIEVIRTELVGDVKLQCFCVKVVEKVI